MNTLNPTRFPMTTGTLVKVLSVMSGLIAFVMLPVQLFIVVRYVPVPEARWIIVAVMLASFSALTITFLLAPRAVKVSGGRLVVERLAWSDFSVPLRQLTSVEPGPALQLITGDVRRVAGNGGLMGFTGLFHVKDVGLVRCWATRTGTPTLLVRRSEGRPLLLGVDDADALRAALLRVGVPG
ncbi:MAG: hypothetical protein QM817_28210 [Archangium sp.]